MFLIHCTSTKCGAIGCVAEISDAVDDLCGETVGALMLQLVLQAATGKLFLHNKALLSVGIKVYKQTKAQSTRKNRIR